MEQVTLGICIRCRRAVTSCKKRVTEIYFRIWRPFLLKADAPQDLDYQVAEIWLPDYGFRTPENLLV
jgi:hypothetical protein